MPLELVQRVTGHKTTDVVLKHYFRPGQKDFCLALEGAMPKLLTTGTTPALAAARPAPGGGGPASRTAKEEMRELLGSQGRISR